MFRKGGCKAPLPFYATGVAAAHARIGRRLAIQSAYHRLPPCREPSMTMRMTEDAFLDQRIGQPITIFLISGLKLVGTLLSFDLDVIFLRPHDAQEGGVQMILKSAISTIVSMQI